MLPELYVGTARPAVIGSLCSASRTNGVMFCNNFELCNVHAWSLSCVYIAGQSSFWCFPLLWRCMSNMFGAYLPAQ